MARLFLPEFSKTRADGFHVVRGSHQFEAVSVRNAALAGDDVARIGEFGAEVVVARGDDAADQRPVVLVVQKRDDLFGHITTVVDVRGGPPAAVGGQYQHVRFVDLDAVMQRYPRGGKAQLLHEAVGGLRHAGGIHEGPPRCLQGPTPLLPYRLLRYAVSAAPASALIRSGRKPDQWSFPTTT